MFPIDNRLKAKNFELLALGEMLEQYGGTRIALDVIKKRGTVKDFMRRISDVAKDEPLTAAADRILGLDLKRDAEGYSLSRALKAAYNRNWNDAGLERSISDLVSERTGLVPNGFFVPFAMLSRGFDTATGAGFIANTNLGTLSPDPARKASVLSGLGATFMTGLGLTLEVPTWSASTDPQYLSEVSSSPVLVESTGKTILTPKRVACYIQPSSQAILQVSQPLDITLGRHLMKAVMEQIEVAAINGDGTGNNPQGLRYQAGVGSVVGGTNGAQITYAHLSDLENQPGVANVSDAEFSGYAVNSQTRRWLRTAQRATGLPFIWEGGDRPLLGHRAAVSQVLPWTLNKGTSSGVCSAVAYSADWSNLLIGIYGAGLDIVVDRYTLAQQGLVQITVTAVVGVGNMRPGAFSLMTDALTV